MSLLEKEARDPVEVLRAKLKDCTTSSLLDARLLQEIKSEYAVKEASAKAQLQGFVQTQVDELERASGLLELETPVQQIVQNLDELGKNCRRMNEELGEKKATTSGVSIARRNLRELENLLVFYDELPDKLQGLHNAFESESVDIVAIYTKWQEIDDWRQKMLHELRVAISDKTDDLASSKTQSRIKASMASRMSAIKSVQDRILGEVWGCMHHCVEVAQIDKQRLLDAFRVLELMETRRQRFENSKKDTYLDDQLKPVAEFYTPCSERCKTEITTFLSRRVETMFRSVEGEVGNGDSQELFNSVLEAANHLLMDLEIVQAEVAACFPNEIDVVHLFTSTYNTLLENEITRLCTSPDVGIAQRLQLVQWIEYYNSEIIKYKRSRASGVLDQTSQMLMKLYLDQIQAQVHKWIANIWSRNEESIVGPQGEIQSTRPNDIINILKSQISIAQEWLSGRLVGCVVASCLQTLMEELNARYESLMLRLETIDIEALCSFINEADVLQAKCPELVEEISFAETDSEDKEAFDNFVGDGLDTASTEIVQLAVSTCDLVVSKIFHEVEQDASRLWFSKKWDDGTPVVESLLVTLDDYYADLKGWIAGSFFFSKVVRQCLNQCVREYSKRLHLRADGFPNPTNTSAIVASDLRNFVSFFEKYSSELRRTGIRSVDDIKTEFDVLQLIVDTLQGTGESGSNQEEHSEVLAHVVKLMRRRSRIETAMATKQNGKEAQTKEASLQKLKRFGVISKSRLKSKVQGDKKSKTEPKAEVTSKVSKESTPRESSFTQHGVNPNEIDVQSLDMASFLGS